MARGRPPKYDVNDIIDKLKEFILAEDEPLIQAFILSYGISPRHFYELAEKNEELSQTIKKAITKQEYYLIKGAESGRINPTFAIFRLKQKQFGWTDKQEIESRNENTNTNTNLTNLSPEERKVRINELIAKRGK